MYIIITILFLFLLDFIPVKFAITKENAKIKLRDGNYICNTEPKIAPPIRWIARTKSNPYLNDDLYLRLTGNSPNNILSPKDYDVDKWYEVDNAFLLIGNTVKSEKHQETKHMIVDLNVNEWEIVYPINRASTRKFYVPKNYLTIYDFDWFKVLKQK